MENVDLKVVKNKLTITVDLSKQSGISKSGKSRVIATTSGNVTIPGTDDVKLGLNIYKPA
jgi:hypothetical protein